jgi:hypothetical protein
MPLLQGVFSNYRNDSKQTQNDCMLPHSQTSETVILSRAKDPSPRAPAVIRMDSSLRSE